MTAQDLAAMAVCVIAALWLVRRLFLSYGPSRRRPDVTTSALLKRTAAQKTRREHAPPDRPTCH